jgi:hypothetical protein
MRTLTDREKQLADLIRDGLTGYQDAVAAYVEPLEAAAGGHTEETLALLDRLAEYTVEVETVWEEITGKPLTLTRALAANPAR